MTPEEILIKTRKFTIGARVIVKESSREYLGWVITRVPARVVERYPHHLVVKRKNGVQESFTYKDIVLLGVLELEQGRLKKVN